MNGGNPNFPIPDRHYTIVDGIKYGYIVDAGRAMIFNWEYDGYIGRAFPCNAVSARINDSGSYYPDFVAGDIAIPSTLDGLPVTKIGHKAFQGCTQVTSVEVPEGVVDIENMAFATNTSMRTFICAASVTNISSTAFDYCTNLTSIVLKGDTKVRYAHMGGAMNLRDLVIPVMKVSDYFYANNVTNLTFTDKGQRNITANLFAKCTDTIYSWNCANVECLTLLGDFDTVAENVFSGTLPNLREVRVGQSTRAKVATALAAAGRDVKVVTIDNEGNVLPDWEIAGFTLVSAGDGTMKTIMVVAVAPRGGERPANVGAEEVAEMFEATSDINDWNGAAKLTPSVEVLEGDGAVMRFNVTPGDGTASSAFLRIRR